MSARGQLARAAALLLASSCATATAPAIEEPHDVPVAGDRAYAQPQAAAKPAGHSRSVTAAELHVIQGLMRDAERVRELRFTRQVEVIVQDAEAIAAYVDRQIEPDKVAKAIDVYASLGLIDPKLDLRALWLRLMGEQVVGYYDLDRGVLAVRDDVMRAFSGERRAGRERDGVDLREARVVLVHELVHALQDQHLGLAQHMHEDLDTDAENALRALVEGDATLAMISHALEGESIPLAELTRDPARIRGLSQMVSAPMKGTELDSAPAVVRVSLLSAYVQGLTFVAALHGSGGFARINRAFADPPVSTEHVLHPLRFARGEQPEHVRMPQADSLLGPGFTLVAQDTIGELEMSVYFAQAMNDAVAARAAEGWNGDRVYAFRTGETRSAVWVSSWDDERQAAEAERAAAAVRSSVPEPARTQHDVVRSGRGLLIARNVPSERLAALRERFSAWMARFEHGKGALARAALSR